MTYTIAVRTVQNSWWWTEELSETCIEFYSKNKFEKLVHLVGFIIRIYHEAPSPERQKSGFCFSNKIKYLYLIINAICCFVRAGQLATVTEIALHTHPNICCVSPRAPSSPAHTSTVYCPGTQFVHSAVHEWHWERKKKLMNEYWLIFHAQPTLQMVLPPTWFLFPMFYHKNASLVKTLCSILQTCFVADSSYKAGLSHSHDFLKQRISSPTDLLWVTN